jgi:hypothetical protein
VIPECGAPLQILFHLVNFHYTCDPGMWRYGITVIAHEALSRIDSYATSQDQFAAERYIRYTSDTIVPHFAITGIAKVVLHYHTIRGRHHIYQTRPSLKFIKGTMSRDF